MTNLVKRSYIRPWLYKDNPFGNTAALPMAASKRMKSLLYADTHVQLLVKVLLIKEPQMMKV